MKVVSLDELKQIVRENGELKGWNFSSIRMDRDPVPWDYTELVRSYLKPTDNVLDIGTGGGEIFLSLAPFMEKGIGIDHSLAMIETAKNNQSKIAINNVEFIEMDGSELHFGANEFDVVLLRHLKVYVSQIVRVLRSGGYFVNQMVGKQSSENILEAFGWTSASFGPDWWQPVDELAQQFEEQGCRVVARGEYDVRYWFMDINSFMFWMMSVPWPEEIDLAKHWQNLNRILVASTTERGIETNEHRGLLIVRKL